MNDIQEQVLETRFWAAYIMPDQRYLGRMVIPLKRPCGQLSEVSPEEFQDFLKVVTILEKLCRNALGATMFNWACLMNDAYQEKSPRPQVHWHFRPRYRTPPIFQYKQFADPNFGHHYLREEGDKVFVPQQFRYELAAYLRQFVGQIHGYR